jgi:hypothetical protein
MTGIAIMANTQLTLADLFLGPQQRLTEAELQQVEQASDTHGAREQLAGRDDAGDWPAAWQQVQAQLPRLFDVPLLDILLASWAKYQQVSQHARADAKEPGKRTTLDLDKRSLSSTHQPRIELRVNDQPIATLPFTIKLELKFKTLRLTLGDGRIWRIESGDCEGVGSVQLSGQTILERRFAKVDLPGSIAFADGIPIPTAEQPYRWGDGPRALRAITPAQPEG